MYDSQHNHTFKFKWKFFFRPNKSRISNSEFDIERNAILHYTDYYIIKTIEGNKEKRQERIEYGKSEYRRSMAYNKERKKEYLADKKKWYRFWN